MPKTYDPSSMISRERFDRLLDQRTRALAARADRAGDAADVRTDMLVCSVGADRYAFSLGSVAGVIAEAATTPALNGPPSLIGLFGRSGLIYSVFDLAALLGLAAPMAPDGGNGGGHFVLLRRDNPRIALRVDRVQAVSALRAERDASEPTQNADSAVTGYARAAEPGQDDGVVAVLDADRLFRLLTSTSADGA